MHSFKVGDLISLFTTSPKLVEYVDGPDKSRPIMDMTTTLNLEGYSGFVMMTDIFREPVASAPPRKSFREPDSLKETSHEV